MEIAASPRGFRGRRGDRGGRLTGQASLSGLLFTLWALAVAVGAQLTGFAMDRLGRRPGLAAGHALLCLSSLAAWRQAAASA